MGRYVISEIAESSFWMAGADRMEGNAYGTVLFEEDNGKRYPVICGHGGSMWFCVKCSHETMMGQEKRDTIGLSGDGI